MKNWKKWWIVIAVLGLLGASPGSGRAQDPTEEGAFRLAVIRLKTAIEASDLKVVGEMAAGPTGKTLRQLAPAFTKAQEAAARLNKSLKDKPALFFTNPFAASLAPLAGMQIDLVEITRENKTTRLRVRTTFRGQTQEETLGVAVEDGILRMDVPSDITKMVRRLSAPPERVERQIKGLEKLAIILGTLADEVEKQKLTTKEAIVVRLLRLVDEAKLAELLDN